MKTTLKTSLKISCAPKQRRAEVVIPAWRKSLTEKMVTLSPATTKWNTCSKRGPTNWDIERSGLLSSYHIWIVDGLKITSPTKGWPLSSYKQRTLFKNCVRSFTHHLRRKLYGRRIMKPKQTQTSETISDSTECNLRLWYSSHIGPPPMAFSPLVAY